MGIEQRQVTASSDKAVSIKHKSLQSACRCRCVMPTCRRYAVRPRGNNSLRLAKPCSKPLARGRQAHAAKAVHPPSKQTTASAGTALPPLPSTVHRRYCSAEARSRLLLACVWAMVGFCPGGISYTAHRRLR